MYMLIGQNIYQWSVRFDDVQPKKEAQGLHSVNFVAAAIMILYLSEFLSIGYTIFLKSVQFYIQKHLV